MASADPLEGIRITVDRAGQLLGIGAERIRQLCKEGYIERPARGVVELIGAVEGYLRFRGEDERRASKTVSLSRVQDARAREIEIRIARNEGSICETEEAIDYLADVLGGLKSDLTGFPAQMTRDLEMRAKLEAGLEAILNRAADRAHEGGQLLGGGRPAAPIAEEDAA